MYAAFTPLSEDVVRRENERRENAVKQQGEIAKYVQMHQLTEMKNPFLDISSYFLDIKDGKVYEVTNDGSIPPYFKHVTDPRTLKSLKDASC